MSSTPSSRPTCRRDWRADVGDVAACGTGGCGDCGCSAEPVGAGEPTVAAWEPVAPLGTEVFDGGTVSVPELLAGASRRFADAGIPTPEADAAVLLSQLLGRGRSDVAYAPPVTAAAAEYLLAAVERRSTREPLQHVLGVAWFRHLELAVGPGVFVPRPETESLVDAALAALPPTGPAVVVDLGAGSGAISLALATERPQTTCYAVEIDPAAMRWLAGNVQRHSRDLARVGSRIVAVLGDAGAVARPDQPLAPLAGSVPVVVSNPPYIPDDAVPVDPEVAEHDPALALYGGPDGLDVVRRWLDTAADLLVPGGTLLMEHADQQGGDHGLPGLIARHEDVSLGRAVWQSVDDLPDLAGRPRHTVARRAH